MIRSDFLKLTLLAPLARLFGWKSSAPGLNGNQRSKVEEVVAERGGTWRAEFARDVYTSPSGKEYTLEAIEGAPGCVRLHEGVNPVDMT